MSRNDNVLFRIMMAECILGMVRPTGREKFHWSAVVVSLSKTHELPMILADTKESLALSQTF